MAGHRLDKINEEIIDDAVDAKEGCPVDAIKEIDE